AVERAEIGEVEPAALRRVRIGVGQMREIRVQRRLAMHGDRPDRRAHFGVGRRRGGQQRGPERKANQKSNHRLKLSTGKCADSRSNGIFPNASARSWRRRGAGRPMTAEIVIGLNGYPLHARWIEDCAWAPPMITL